MKTVIIVDDHPLFRKGVKLLVESKENFKVVAEAGSGKEAEELIAKHKPNVVIMDLSLPDISGLDLVRQYKAADSDVNFVILTMYNDDEMIQTALDLHVKGYVLKDAAEMDLSIALERASEGHPYISPDLYKNIFKQKAKITEMEDKLSGLSPTEKKILKLTSEMKSSKEIAEELFIHYRTVENHRSNICRKLGLNGSYSLLKFAFTSRDKIANI